MIVKAVITYEDGSEATFVGTPEIPAVPAQGVDLSQIPTSAPEKAAEQTA